MDENKDFTWPEEYSAIFNTDSQPEEPAEEQKAEAAEALSGETQPEPAEEYAYSDVFFTEYEQIRGHLQERMAALRDAGVPIEFSCSEAC